MTESTDLAQKLHAAADGFRLGKGHSEGLLSWLGPLLPALGHPEAPVVQQKKLGSKAAAVREHQQHLLLQEQERDLPKQRQQLQQLLKVYAATSPACIELLELVDVCNERLLQKVAEVGRTGQRGLPEGISPAAARMQQQQQQQQLVLLKGADEAEEAARAAQVAALIASAIIREESLDSLPSAAATRSRLAAAIAAPSRLLSFSSVLLPFPTAAGSGKQHALLQLCICRLLASAAAFSPAAAWRIASAAQGATAAAAAAAAESLQGEGGGVHEKVVQQHPLQRALICLCEGPCHRLQPSGSSGTNSSSRRSGGSGDSSLLPPPPRALGRLCGCRHCVETAASAATAAAAGKGEGVTGDDSSPQLKRNWHNAWGPFSVRCCCLSCCEETDPTNHSRRSVCRGGDQHAAAAAGAAEFGGGEHLAVAAAAAAAAVAGVRAAVRRLRTREAQEGLGGCGVVPIRYALRQEVLRLLLLLLLHSDPLVSSALLQQRRRPNPQQQLQLQHQHKGSRDGVGDPSSSSSSSSSSKQEGGLALVRAALRGLSTDRELDALCLLVGLFERFSTCRKKGQSPETEAAARRLFLVSGGGGFPVPLLLQRLAAKEQLSHLLLPLLSPWQDCCSSTAAAAAPSASAAAEALTSDHVEPLPAYFSSAWTVQRLLGFLLLQALGRGDWRGPSLCGAPQVAAEQQGGDTNRLRAGVASLVSVALAVRPVHMPPQQELLLQLFRAHPAAVAPFLARISGVLLTPRKTSTFALSCLFLCRLLEAPLSSTRLSLYQAQQQQHLLGRPGADQGESCSLPGLEGESEQQQQKEDADCFGELEPLRRQHALQQHEQQMAVQQQWRAVGLAVLHVAPPVLLLRQHLSQCLLQQDISLAFFGVSVLRACCHALRYMHGALKHNPEQQRLFLTQVAPRLPDAKTLVNSLLRLTQHHQKLKKQEQQMRQSEHRLGLEEAVFLDCWLSDEALARAAAAAAAAAAKEQRKRDVESLRQQGPSEASDDDQVEVHVAGVERENADRDNSETLVAQEEASQETPQRTYDADKGVPLKDLLQLFFRQGAPVRDGQEWGPKEACGYSLTGPDGPDSEDIFLQFALRCLDSADAYQDMLMPSFPLEWGKLLCTWKAGETSISIGAAGATGVPGRLQLCCSSPCLAADITHLGVQARGGVDTWGDEIALGTPVSKQQQLLLLHLLLQWHADVQRSRQMLPDKQGPPTVELSQDFLVCRQRSSPLHILLRLLHKSGLFADLTVGPSCLDEAAVWLASLEDSACFRCSALYFVGLLRLASERRLSLLAYCQEHLAGEAAARQEDARGHAAGAAAGTEAGSNLCSLSVFSLAVLSHLSLTPRCSGGRLLFVEIPPFGVGAPRESCWGYCSPLHAEELCAAALAGWAVQGFMRCCMLSPSWGPPLLHCLDAEGPWRVVGAALNVGASAKPDQQEQRQEEEETQQEQQQQQQQAEAARAAASQHPQYESVNKCRRRLRRFLKASSSREGGLHDTQGPEEEGRKRLLDSQLGMLSGVVRRQAARWNPHSMRPADLLEVFAAQLPGAQMGPLGGPAATAGWINGLGLLRALTQHIAEVLLPASCGGVVEEAAEAGGETMSERLYPLLVQLEAVTRHLRDAAIGMGGLPRGYPSLLSPRETLEAGPAGQLTLLSDVVKVSEKLLRFAVKAIGGLQSPCTPEQSHQHLTQNGWQKKRIEHQKGISGGSSSHMEALNKWTEVGAVLICHTANLLQAAAAEEHTLVAEPSPWQKQQQLALQRILRRAIELAATLLQAWDLQNPDNCALSFRCMRHLDLAASLQACPPDGYITSGKSHGSTQDKQKKGGRDQEEMETQQCQKAQTRCQREETPVGDQLLALLHHLTAAARPFAGEDGEPLLLLAAEAIVCRKGATNAAGAPAGLAHLRWLLPMLLFWGQEEGAAIDTPAVRLTGADRIFGLSLVLHACGAAPSSPAELLQAPALPLVQHLQALSDNNALRLFSFLHGLWEGPNEKQRAVASAGICSLAPEKTLDIVHKARSCHSRDALLRSAEKVMVCLCLQISPGGTAVRGDEGAVAASAADAAVVFRQGLVRTLFACWDQSRSFRSACIRLFLPSESAENSEETIHTLVHPAVRLALLLQWRDPMQDLHESFYPSVTAALRRCQGALQGGDNKADAESSSNSNSRKRRKAPASNPNPGGAGWAGDVMEALKWSVFARDSNEGPSGKRVRAKGAPWQVAALFLNEGPEGEGLSTCLLATEAPILWAKAVQHFLASLAMQQPGRGTALVRLSVELARELEELAGSLEEPFAIEDGWPVDGWARYQLLSVMLHAAGSGSKSCVDASAEGLRAVGAARGCLGAALKDLKTELGELQEALAGSGDLSDEAVYSAAGEDGAAAASADLAYYLGAVCRAEQLGKVIVHALQPRRAAGDACLTKEQKQFFKALRPKAQSIAKGFLEALGNSPPSAAVHCGAAALLKPPAVVRNLGLSPTGVITEDLLAVQAWVFLILPAVRLTMMGASLSPSPDAAAAYAKEAARQTLSCPALAALGSAAKQTIRKSTAALGQRIGTTATGLAVVLCPLLQCLCDELLPAANVHLQGTDEELQTAKGLNDEQENEEEPFCRVSEMCPDLFEALVQLYGGSTSRVDSYICQILTLDSAGPHLGGRAEERLVEAEGLEGPVDPDHASGSTPRETEGATDTPDGGSCEVFGSDYIWMAELPDFREVCVDANAQASAACDRIVQPVSLSLGGPCDWLALDPRRVKETLDAFAFHSKLVQPKRFALGHQQCINRWKLASAASPENEEVQTQVQVQLLGALKARSSVTRETEFQETEGSGGGRQTSVGASELSRCLEALESSYELKAVRDASVESSAYDLSYLIPFLTGRLTAACFVLLWRWQRLLEEEQEHQQQTRLQLQQHLQQQQQREEEEGKPSGPCGDALIALGLNRPVCAAEEARRACGVAGAWLRYLEEATPKLEEAAGSMSAPEGAKMEPAGKGECASGAQPKETPVDTGPVAPEIPAQQTKRRREDVWEMDEFNPQEVQPAVTRVSTFLKAARRIGRLWKPLLANAQDGQAHADAQDQETTARKLEAWGAVIDDGDQWLSNFASGGGLQLLIMALGCPDSCTRATAAHGLAVYTHLLQLSADRSLLRHFAEVHAFNMQNRKRHSSAAAAKARGSRWRETQHRHKAATFAFREVKELLTLLTSLMASIQQQQRQPSSISAASARHGRLQASGIFQAVSPVTCSFAAAAVPLLFLPDLPLYPVLNFALLKHPAVSVLLQEPCMPLTLAALRQPLLGSDGLFSRLLLCPSAATSAEQKRFLLLVLKRAMAVSQCTADGSVAVSSRLLQAHRISQAVLPPPALLALSAMPVLGDISQNASLSRSLLDALLLSTAAPACLSACTWWTAHAAFSRTAAQAELCCARAATEGPTNGHSGAYVQPPLATVNAQHLLQRYGILQWLRAQVEAVLTSLGASPRIRRGTAFSVAGGCASLASQPVPPPVHAVSSSTNNNQLNHQPHACLVDDRGQAGGLFEASRMEGGHRAAVLSKMVPPMRDCTRLLWSLIAGSALAAPFPCLPSPRLCVRGSSVCCPGDGVVSQGVQTAAVENINWGTRALHADCKEAGDCGSEGQAPSGERQEAEETVHCERFWPLEEGPDNLPLLHAALKARRQLFKLRQSAESSEKEETGARGEASQTSPTTGIGNGLRRAHAARHLLLDLLQGLQRLARAWFIFGEAAGVFVRARAGEAGSMLGCTVTPNLVSDLLDASVACLSSLWALAACSQSVGLLEEDNDASQTLGPLQRQHTLQASSCCGDILRLCAWSAVLHANTSRGRTQQGGACKELNPCWYRCKPLWETVYFLICERGLGSPSCPKGSCEQADGVTGRNRWVRLGLQQIQQFCGAKNEMLQQLIAVAEGL